MARKPSIDGVAEAGALFDLPADPPPMSATALGAEGHRARMRARLLKSGPDALADHEMLEMVLFLALPRRDTKPIARALLTRFGDLGQVLAAPVPELLRVEGVGEAGAAALAIVRAAALRLLRADAGRRTVLADWDALLAYLRAALAHERVEQVRVLFLDNRNRLIADEQIARGTVNHAPVYPREIARRALELHATSVILVHNHPAGDPTPSRDDIEMTRQVRAALEVLRIALHDHLVVASSGTLSFRARGLI